MSRIVDVEANDDHTLTIRLDNNHKIICDMKSRLQSVRFCELSNLEIFKSVRVENGNTLVWDCLSQMTIDEIIQIIER